MKLFTPTLLLAISALGVDAVGVNDSPYKTARLIVSTIQSAVQTAEDMDTGNYKDLGKMKEQLRMQFQGSVEGLRD
ncbi:hypothetical protein N7447_001880 [Penicillium robsamsonii]|uniref:uncharacterized protein n=1 Tax=Penicillium robsamsonii TaxID=1792511 RepID=UPI0025493262|nr:uncharacterized protein N7447_001880 [Penicillium robsamsonii]KAJ5835854.1 hypothetical protein N7447_001880 [Penicillium robsamsonii]